MTQQEILNSLESEVKDYASRFTLRDAILKFGTKEDDKTYIQTELGNIVVSDKNLLSNRIFSDPKECVYLFRAGKWYMIDNNLKIDV